MFKPWWKFFLNFNYSYIIEPHITNTVIFKGNHEFETIFQALIFQSSVKSKNVDQTNQSKGQWPSLIL